METTTKSNDHGKHDIKITDYTEIKLVPKCKNPAAAKLLPTVLVPVKCSFTLHNVNNAISNGLRRTIACELPVKYLFTDHVNIITNDDFILSEMVINDIKSIPIKQSASNVTFKCNVKNMTTMPLDVKSGDLISSDGKDYFNETITICTIMPGRSFEIDKISIESGINYIKGNGNVSLASAVSSTCIDVLPLSEGGQSCSVSNPRVWAVTFITNGTILPKDIITNACESLISRVGVVPAIEPIIVGNKYSINVPNESATIGNLFMKTIINLYPKIHHVRFDPSPFDRNVSIEITCDEPIDEIITAAHDFIIIAYKKIMSII